MEGKEWRIKKVERRTHYIGNTRGSVKTSGKGRFENMRVDREGGICAFGQVFAHADLVRCTWSLRLYRYKKRRGIEWTMECGFNFGTREGT